MAKPETYSTEKAWRLTPQENAQAKMFERLANGLRKENEHLQKEIVSKDIYIEQLEEDKEETKDHIATIELSAKGVQQEHGISFEDACWVVDKMRDSNETNESLSFSEDYFVDEIKGKNEGKKFPS